MLLLDKSGLEMTKRSRVKMALGKWFTIESMAQKNFAWLKWLGVLLFVPSFFLNLYLFSSIRKNDQGILVLAVIDGDTLLLEGKVRLRLRQVDAPELGSCGGTESNQFLEKLVKGKKVTTQEQVLDQWGRPMALVYQGRILVNLEILKNGWGRYHHDTSSREEDLKKAGELAKERQRGIFSPSCYQKENLGNPTCLIKGNIDKNDQTIKRYYFPGCTQYEFTIVEKDLGEQWFCSEKEAEEAGFERSKTCP